MKVFSFKPILYITLILSLMASSFAFSRDSFLSAINLDSEFKGFNEVSSEIKKIAHHGYGYVSLGETHNEPRSAHAIYQVLVENYFKDLALKHKDVRSCLENIDTFLKSSTGDYIVNHSQDVSIRERNSPSLTDFKDCQNSQYDHYFLYSGLFHQYPFARKFSEIFPSVPVFENPGNNIKEQMQPVKGVFVSQLELKWLISVEGNAFLQKNYTQLTVFKEVLEFRKKTIAELKSKMQPVLVQNDIDDKQAIVLSKKNFDKDIQQVIPRNAYFLLTDYLRDAHAGVYRLYSELLEEHPEIAEQILIQHSYKKAIFLVEMIEPTVDGRKIMFNFGGFDRQFELGGEYLQIAINAEEKMLIVAPSNEKNLVFLYRSNGIEKELSSSEALTKFHALK